MVFCDEAPPHPGSLEAKILSVCAGWGVGVVCLFSPCIVTLIMRNWRRCILVCVEFEVPTPHHLPSCRRLSSLVDWKWNKDGHAGFYWAAMKTLLN